MAYSGEYGRRRQAREAPSEETAPPRSETAPQPRRTEEKRMLPDLNSLFQRVEAAGMDTDDLLMALILFLMYRESGDVDLLILLGVMLLG